MAFHRLYEPGFEEIVKRKEKNRFNISIELADVIRSLKAETNVLGNPQREDGSAD